MFTFLKLLQEKITIVITIERITIEMCEYCPITQKRSIIKFKIQTKLDSLKTEQRLGKEYILRIKNTIIKYYDDRDQGSATPGPHPAHEGFLFGPTAGY